MRIQKIKPKETSILLWAPKHETHPQNIVILKFPCYFRNIIALLPPKSITLIVTPGWFFLMPVMVLPEGERAAYQEKNVAFCGKIQLKCDFCEVMNLLHVIQLQQFNSRKNGGWPPTFEVCKCFDCRRSTSYPSLFMICYRFASLTVPRSDHKNHQIHPQFHAFGT